MRERPIPFSSDMVRAILEGRKTMTRRPVKPQPIMMGGIPVQKIGGALIAVQHHKCPYGQPGDRLWVRETWYCDHYEVQRGPYLQPKDLKEPEALKEFMYYRATDLAPNGQCNTGFSGETMDCPWKPSIHMPRWASRITLEVVKVRVERLWEITPMDCISEGIQRSTMLNVRDRASEEITRFKNIWNSLYTKKPEFQWEANPWVFVI
ncbi:MAG TPA: hypothetical protein VMW42_06360, partial [Desulfatiglandales bacterium]|nr:hypothetical protein [Desulfatiglandales bacterium]